MKPSHAKTIEVERQPLDTLVKFTTSADRADIIEQAARIKRKAKAEFLRDVVEPVAVRIVEKWQRDRCATSPA